MRGLILLLVSLSALGCVERKLIIRPDPEDALVFVDGRELPREGEATERTLTFEHYGIRNVIVRKAGYQVSSQMVTLDPPWWQITPFDFVTDILWPAKLEDHRTVEVKLEKRQDLQSEDAAADILRRAREAEAASLETKKP